jgi:hypothetical protein
MTPNLRVPRSPSGQTPRHRGHASMTVYHARHGNRHRPAKDLGPASSRVRSEMLKSFGESAEESPLSSVLPCKYADTRAGREHIVLGQKGHLPCHGARLTHMVKHIHHAGTLAV